MNAIYLEVIGNLCKEGLVINDNFRNYSEVRWEDPNFDARLNFQIERAYLKDIAHAEAVCHQPFDSDKIHTSLRRLCETIHDGMDGMRWKFAYLDQSRLGSLSAEVKAPDTTQFVIPYELKRKYGI